MITTVARQTRRSISMGLLHETIARLTQHIARARTRRLLRELDEHQLKDIGLSRSELASW